MHGVITLLCNVSKQTAAVARDTFWPPLDFWFTLLYIAWQTQSELQKCPNSGLGHLNSICSFTGSFEALLRAVVPLRSVNLCVSSPPFFLSL